MNKDKISAFTLKIASSNGSELISILYDIYEVYESEALEALSVSDLTEANKAINKCSEVVVHLQKDLNFSYGVSKDLYSLYDYVKRALARSIYMANDQGIRDAKVVMDKLGEAFSEVAANDKSAPLMKNTQKVVAGYTYGRNSLNEGISGNEYSRGFWA